VFLSWFGRRFGGWDTNVRARTFSLLVACAACVDRFLPAGLSRLRPSLLWFFYLGLFVVLLYCHAASYRGMFMPAVSGK